MFVLLLFTQNRVRKYRLNGDLKNGVLIDKRLLQIFMRQIRSRKTDGKTRRAIIQLYATGEWKMAELGLVFGVTRSRISQIVTDYYEEAEAIHDLS